MGKHRVLVLSKEKDLCRLISKGLENEGFVIHSLLEPEKVVESVKTHRPDLILLDVKFQDISAKEIIAGLDKEDCRVPFAVMLNKGEESLAEELIALGARDYLVKETGFLEFLPYVAKKIVEQVEIEEQLVEARKNIEKTEAELRLVSENMLDLVGKVDEEGIFKYVSPSYKTVLGYESMELLGQSAFDYIFPEDLQQAVMAFQKGVTAPAPSRKEVRFKHKDGSYLWLEVKVSLTFDAEGKINGTIWVSRDVTKQKEIEERLKTCKDKYRNLMDSLPVGVFRTTPGDDGEFLTANAAFVELMGYASEGDLQKIKVREVYEAPQTRKRLSKEVLEKGAVLGNQLQLIKKDGTYLWCIENIRVIQGDMGVQLESIIEDVTELKLAEKEINSQKKYFGALFKSSTDAIAYINLEHQLEDVNIQFTKLFGYTLEELKGRDVDRVLVPGQKLLEAKHLTEMVLTGASVNLETTRFCKDGKPMEVSVKGIPVLIDGEIVGCYTIYTDITERKRVEDAVQRSDERHREIMAAIEESYYEMDLAGNIVFCNDAACRLMGHRLKDLLDMDFPRLFKDPGVVYRAFHRIYLSGKPEKGFTLEAVSEKGYSRFEEFSISLIKDKYGKAQGFRGVGRDVTERLKYEEKLKQLSLYDQMTGLYNRTYFEEELRRLEGGRDYPITIITADLDGLKLINDTMGHHQGDELLRNCARVLRKPLRSSDVLARVGGDEFTAILPRTDEKTGDNIIERINNALEGSNVDNPELPLSVSLGAATAQGTEQPLEEIFKKADSLMYKDKLHRSSASRTKIVNALLQVLLERDHISDGHGDRLEELAKKVADKVGLSPRQQNDLSLLAQVHDLGKVGIPEKVLFKKGKLNADDWEIIRQHPEKGYRIASSSPNLAGVADLILRHHEWWDGTGYPLGLKGEDIPIECRIISIIDAYDNMIHGFYSQPMSREEAIRELRKNSGTQFDPELTEVVIGVINSEIS